MSSFPSTPGGTPEQPSSPPLSPSKSVPKPPVADFYKPKLTDELRKKIEGTTSAVPMPSLNLGSLTTASRPTQTRNPIEVQAVEEQYRRAGHYFDSLSKCSPEEQAQKLQAILTEGILAVADQAEDFVLPSVIPHMQHTKQLGFFLEVLRFSVGVINEEEKPKILQVLLKLKDNEERLQWLNKVDGPLGRFPLLREHQKIYVFLQALKRSNLTEEEQDRLQSSIQTEEPMRTAIRAGKEISVQGRLFAFALEQGCIINKPVDPSILRKYDKSLNSKAPEQAPPEKPVDDHTTLKQDVLDQNIGVVIPELLKLTEQQLLEKSEQEQNGLFNFIQIPLDMLAKVGPEIKAKLREFTFWKMKILLERLVTKDLQSEEKFGALSQEEKELFFSLYKDKDQDLWPVTMPQDMRSLLATLSLLRSIEEKKLKEQMLAAHAQNIEQQLEKTLVLPPTPSAAPQGKQSTFDQPHQAADGALLDIQEATTPIQPFGSLTPYYGGIVHKPQTHIPEGKEEISNYTQVMEFAAFNTGVQNSLRLIEEMEKQRNDLEKQNSRRFYESVNQKEGKTIFYLLPPELSAFMPLGTFYKVYDANFQEYYPDELMCVQRAWRQGMPLGTPESKVLPGGREITIPNTGSHQEELGQHLDIIKNPHPEKMPDSEYVCMLRMDKDRHVYLKPHLTAGTLIRLSGPNIAMRLKSPLELYKLLDVDNPKYRGYVDDVTFHRTDKTTILNVTLRFDDGTAKGRQEIKIDLASTVTGLLAQEDWQAVKQRYQHLPDYATMEGLPHQLFVNRTKQGTLEFLHTDTFRTEEYKKPTNSASQEETEEPRPVEIKRILGVEQRSQQVCLFEWRSDLPFWRYIRKEDGVEYPVEPLFASALDNLPLSNANTDASLMRKMAMLFGRKIHRTSDGSLEDSALELRAEPIAYDLEYPSWSDFQELARKGGRIIGALMDMTHPADRAPLPSMTEALPTASFLRAVGDYLYEGNTRRAFSPNKEKQMERQRLIARFEEEYCGVVLNAFDSYIKSKAALAATSATTAGQKKLAGYLEQMAEDMYASAIAPDKFLSLYNAMAPGSSIDTIMEYVPPDTDILRHYTTQPENGLMCLFICLLEELSDMAKQHGIAPEGPEDAGKAPKKLSLTKHYSQESALRTVHGGEKYEVSRERIDVYIREQQSPLGEQIRWLIEHVPGGHVMPRGCSVHTKETNHLLKTDPLLAEVSQDISMGIFDVFMDGPVRDLFHSTVKTDGQLRGVDLWLAFEPYRAWYQKLGGEEPLEQFKATRRALLQTKKDRQESKQ